ncbi:MAG: sulfatase-like hydrolase/transferase [Lachnospiraceae bacterium]|jgi:arylsulfatase A-like enzyme
MSKQAILIMTDSTRKDMLGCYGNKNMITPNLDRMAEEGIRYENAYTCQPVCGPARSAIFTGIAPHSNGVVANSVPMGANVKTIGQRLTDNGIHCAYIGKWHLDGGDYFGLGVCPDGWDPEYWYDMRCYLNELSEKERVLSRQPETSFREDMTEKFTYAYRCTQRALDFIDKHSDEDFFLTLSYDEPHDPSICPSPFNTMYEGFQFDDNPGFHDDLSKKPLMQQLWAEGTAPQSNQPSKALTLFLGCNSFVDYLVGSVLEKVKEKLDNPLIMFTSDHGEMGGSHHLRGKNAAVYKEVANVPLIICGGQKGKVENHVASHIDITPTILDYVNVPIPRLLEGKSMLPQINDTQVSINDVVYTEFTRYEIDHDGFGGLQMMRAAITEDYKLAIHLYDTDEFYDLKKDPYEVDNLINDPAYAEVRNHLHDLLLNHMNDTRDVYRGYQWAARPWRKDKQPGWSNDGYTRQRENEEYEPRQLDYDTGLEMVSAVRRKKIGK